MSLLEHFEQLYADSPDPWQVGTDWYERRKRRLLMSSLPREQYRHALEAGCGNGQMSIELLQRCTRLTAVDFSGKAIALCHARIPVAQQTCIELQAMALPQYWPHIPPSGFDLIVASEIAYYFDTAALSHFYQRCLGSLCLGGHLVWCHWRHAAPDRLQATDVLHERLGKMPQLRSLVRHVETDFLLNVWELTSQKEIP